MDTGCPVCNNLKIFEEELSPWYIKCLNCNFQIHEGDVLPYSNSNSSAKEIVNEIIKYRSKN